MENILLESIKTSLIDENIESGENYQHRLLCNKDEKIIIDLRKEFEDCDEFIISRRISFRSFSLTAQRK